MSFLPTPQIHAFSKQHEFKEQEPEYFKVKEQPHELKEYSQSHIPMKTEHKLKPPPTFFKEFEENENFVNFTPSRAIPAPKEQQFFFLEEILKINHQQILD